jgi:hypothetical protein
MVAYLFPPVGGIGVAGSQRVLKFAKYLPDNGWQPVVLSVTEGSYESYFSTDPSLLKKIPADTLIVRTSVIRWLTRLLELKGRLKSPRTLIPVAAPSVTEHSQPTSSSLGVQTQKGFYQRVKDAITDLFEIPDEEMGWILPGTIGGLSAFRRYRCDAIFATGRPWSALLIGVLLKRLTGRPLIVDFRDPWMTNPFRLQYSPMRNRLESWLERQVIQQANVVIANTHELQEEFVKRFPAQPSEKFMTLLNGFDSDDFGLTFESAASFRSQAFTVTHTGFLYGKRDPMNFLEAVRVCLEQGRVARDKVKIMLIGSAELPYSLTDYLRTAGLSDVVRLQAHVPYRESLDYLRRSDVLLLLQPGTKTQVPSKLFDYIGVGKPIFGISPLDGATSNLMVKHRLGAVADPDNIEGIAHAFTNLYEAWRTASLESVVDREEFQRFDVRNVTETLAAKLSSAAAAVRS